jgi:hypothetical protein
MAERGTTDHHTAVTLLGSLALTRPDGQAAILLVTKELGAIVFEVNQHAIDTLRRELVVAERSLRQPTAKH